MRHNCVHFLATDTHRPERRPPILSKGRDAAARIIGAERAHKLVEDNPRYVVNGEPVPIESPVPFGSSGRGEKKSFLAIFWLSIEKRMRFARLLWWLRYRSAFLENLDYVFGESNKKERACGAGIRSWYHPDRATRGHPSC